MLPTTWFWLSAAVTLIVLIVLFLEWKFEETKPRGDRAYAGFIGVCECGVFYALVASLVSTLLIQLQGGG